MSRLIDAYETGTGRKVRVPEHWIGHPALGAGLSKTPGQKARDKAATAAPTKAPATGDKKE